MLDSINQNGLSFVHVMSHFGQLGEESEGKLQCCLC